MKIQSKFKDYYDCGIAYGQDKNINYIRNKYELSFDSNYKNYNKDNNEKIREFYSDNKRFTDFKNNLSKLIGSKELKTIDKNKRFEVKKIWISFCGNLIPHFIIELFEVNHISKYQNKKGKILNTFNIYNENEYKEFLEEYLPEKSDSIFDRHYNKQDKINEEYNDFIDMKKSLEIYNKEIEWIHKLFKTPIISYNNYIIKNEEEKRYNNMIHMSGITINPILKEIQFKKYIDPIKCFQEISMYIAYLNNPEQEIETIDMDDKVIQQAKGFDSHSFKKRPTKNKHKKCS